MTVKYDQFGSPAFDLPPDIFARLIGELVNGRPGQYAKKEAGPWKSISRKTSIEELAQLRDDGYIIRVVPGTYDRLREAIAEERQPHVQ